MNHSEKRAFVSEIIEILNQEKQSLQDAGFNTDMKISALEEKSQKAETAEVEQQKLMAQSKEATIVANETLEAAYSEASATVDLITGLLGKDNELVKNIKKIRK